MESSHHRSFFCGKNENLSMLNASNFLSIGQGKCYVAHLKYSVTPDNFSSYKFVFYALMAQCSFCLANALIPSIQTGWEMTDLSFQLSCKVRRLNGSKNALWILREVSASIAQIWNIVASRPKLVFTPTFIFCSPICSYNCGVVFLRKYILVFEKWLFSFDRSNMQIFSVTIIRVVRPHVTIPLDLRHFCQHNTLFYHLNLILGHYVRFFCKL